MKPRATKAGELARERVFRAAMRLYRKHGHQFPVTRFMLHPKSGRIGRVWYRSPYDILEDLMRACAAARPRSKPSKPRGKR